MAGKSLSDQQAQWYSGRLCGKVSDLNRIIFDFYLILAGKWWLMTKRISTGAGRIFLT